MSQACGAKAGGLVERTEMSSSDLSTIS
jgi:hypothetical protein